MAWASVSARTWWLAVSLAAAAACGGEDKSLEGEPCIESTDCADDLVCDESVCIDSGSRDLYEVCIRDGQCVSGTCAAGFCTSACTQSYPLGTYRLGDCVADAEMSQCRRGGVGCCLVTAVDVNAYDQQEVRGFCTTAP